MKQPALVPTLLALALAVGSSMALAPGCGGEATPPSTGGSGGSDTTTTTTTGGTGGATTTSNPQCDLLCAHLDAIDCTLLQNCATDCPNHLNAPRECVDAADALIACWVEHLKDFKCTQQGALPPAACSEVETVYNACVGGGLPDASCLCSTGVGSGGQDQNKCARKTTCGNITYNQTCQQVAEGQPWTCTCLANDGLLGTCSEPEEFIHCSNDTGCCVPLFCAVGSQ